MPWSFAYAHTFSLFLTTISDARLYLKVASVYVAIDVLSYRCYVAALMIAIRYIYSMHCVIWIHISMKRNSWKLLVGVEDQLGVLAVRRSCAKESTECLHATGTTSNTHFRCCAPTS